MSATAPPVQSVAARRDMLALRQKESRTWWLIHRLGSLNFALVLLATIALACAAATFAESGFNTRIAHVYIYKNPLFLVWLGALCVNLFAVTLTRWPWQKKHAGFIVTHYGIITLLFGAMIGMHTGFEGNVTLQKNAPATSRVTTSRSIIQLESPADSALYLMPFDAEATPPSERRPRIFPVPGTSLKIVADDFSPNLIQDQKFIPSDSPEAAPSALLKFSSKTAGQTLNIPLTLKNGQPAEEDFFGLARINFRPVLSAPPSAEEEETQMVFARYAPIVESDGVPLANIRLSEDGSKVTIISAEGIGATYLRKDVMNQPIVEASATITFEKYWPDFEMKNGQPVSKSDSANNPALLARISKSAPVKDARPSLEIAPAGDGLSYQLLRGNRLLTSGKAGLGVPFALGWADWQAEVLQVLPNGILTSETKPGPPLEKDARGVPGFRAHLENADAKVGARRWIESGQVTSLVHDATIVRVAYGLESKPVPFSVRLTNFEIPRDEGTDTPADFLATLEFRDAKTGAISTGVAHMNHPASFPGTVLANFTGINYKFSQAEWNPKNLDETTLQVLYDPGWLLKWLGSLGICLGIATMFYWKPGKS